MSNLNDFTNKNTSFTGTNGVKMPVGTTGERVNEQARFRFNSTLALMEYYNGTTWIAVDAPPTVSSVDVTNINESDTTTTIVITGSNFSTSPSVTFISDTGTEVSPNTTTRNSDTQITTVVTNSNFSNAQEPYDVKVTNSSGLANTLADQINVNANPTWTTSAGSLGTIGIGSAMSTVTLVASDPEGGDIDYIISAGGLPPGISLNSETGAITGTPTGSETTYNFTVQAYDTASNFTARAFSLSTQAFNYFGDGSDGAGTP